MNHAESGGSGFIRESGSITEGMPSKILFGNNYASHERIFGDGMRARLSPSHEEPAATVRSASAMGALRIATAIRAMVRGADGQDYRSLRIPSH